MKSNERELTNAVKKTGSLSYFWWFLPFVGVREIYWHVLIVRIVVKRRSKQNLKIESEKKEQSIQIIKCRTNLLIRLSKDTHAIQNYIRYENRTENSHINLVLLIAYTRHNTCVHCTTCTNLKVCYYFNRNHPTDDSNGLFACLMFSPLSHDCRCCRCCSISSNCSPCLERTAVNSYKLKYV